ncbi:MAG: hypothetical protein B6242_12340 [Anaerolineaceae bacterium 4572_78]|nr:MAG: hypothetical protein B6242_12340 [Anaerolineaceae bacterium 4572_78]
MNNKKRNILIVDDNPTNLSVLFDYLGQANFKVLVAEDGHTALKRVKYLRPDIILLDVMMPGIDGFETCRRLKNDETNHDIPVIFMTARSETVDKIKGFEVGAVDYITKPIDVAEVLARINTHLKIQDLQTRLEEEVAELKAFGHTVSHDLKNPLSSVIMASQILMDEDTEIETEQQQSFIKMIYDSGIQATHIINELMLLTGVREGDAEIEELDMATIVEDVQTHLAQMIEMYQATIIVPDTWLPSQGYAPWVEQVWVNYVSNAMKYGGSPPIVQFGVTPEKDGFTRFWVKDNGKGLTPKQRAKVFTEFVRLNEINVEGHGLGLSIVQRIVEKLSGKVGVESRIGKGSTFYFTLPNIKH